MYILQVPSDGHQTAKKDLGIAQDVSRRAPCEGRLAGQEGEIEGPKVENH